MNKKNYLAIFAKSFNWAGFFLPKKIYEDSAILYAFCRVLDNIADEKTSLNSKIKKFNEMRKLLEKFYDTNNFEIHSSNNNEKIIIIGICLSFFSCFPQFICGANAMNKINGASNKLNAKL